MSWIPNAQMAAGMKTAEAEALATREALAHLDALQQGRVSSDVVDPAVAPTRRSWVRRLRARMARRRRPS